MAIASPINEGRTVYDDWLDLQRETIDSLEEPDLTVMGTGSDYTVFFHHLGISSLDLLFNQKGTAVYPYHSNYDSYYWIDKFGDPGFKKHLAMARLWGLLTVKLAGVPVLPFRASDYSNALKRHIMSLHDKCIPGLALDALEISASRFEVKMKILDSSAHRIRLDTLFEPPSSVAEANNVYMKLERSFLFEKGGLPGRPWYKHLVSILPKRTSIVTITANFSRYLLLDYGLVTTESSSLASRKASMMATSKVQMLGLRRLPK